MGGTGLTDARGGATHRRARQHRFSGPAALTLTILTSIAVASLTGLAPASAQDGPPDSSAGCDTGAARCEGAVWDSTSGNTIGSGTNPCTYFVGSWPEVLAQMSGHIVTDPVPPDPDSFPDGALDHPWAIVYCPHSGAGASVVFDLVQLGDPPSTALIDRIARQAISLPLPIASFSPDESDFQIIGLETWVWLEPSLAGPISGFACIQPFDYACVSLTATLVDLRADMGDGNPAVLCEGAGRPYDTRRSYRSQRPLPHCSHVYTDVPADDGDTYTAVATTAWWATWTCAYDPDPTPPVVRTTSCGAGSLGVIGRSGPAQPLEVRDYEARLTVVD